MLSCRATILITPPCGDTRSRVVLGPINREGVPCQVFHSRRPISAKRILPSENKRHDVCVAVMLKTPQCSTKKQLNQGFSDWDEKAI